MSKIETGNFEITPEPFAPAQAIDSCCDLLALKARDAGVELVTPHCRRSAGNRGRQARAQSDPDQSAVQRHQVHAARRPGHRRRAPATGRSLPSRSRTPASASAPTICRGWAKPSSRRARPTTGVMTAPASACRSSRAWWICMAATWISAAAWARAHGSPCGCRSTAKAPAPTADPSSSSAERADELAATAAKLDG